MATSVAYDLSKFETVPSTPRIRVVNTGKELKARADRQFVIKLVLLAVVVIALAVYTVYSSMMLTKTKALIEKRSNELIEIQSENAFLDYQIESVVSTRAVEEYAENELGLIKFSPAQIEYVNLENSNMIVTEENDSVADFDVTTFLSTIMAIFGN